MAIDGCSCKFCPTPGRSRTTAMPARETSSAGPIPARSRKTGERGSAGGEDHAAGRDDLAADAHAGDLFALHHQPFDHGVGADGQVGPRPRRRIEIAHRRRDALLAVGGQRQREPAILEHPVLVADIAIALGRESARRGTGEAGPLGFRHAADSDRPRLAVQRAVIIHVGLELAEIGQHALPAPARGAEFGPFVVIDRQAAIADLAIDARPASDHPGLAIRLERRPVGMVVRHRQQIGVQPLPLIGGVERGTVGINVLDLVRLRARRMVDAGLDQQHTIGAFRRQPVGHDAPGRAAADDDVVVALAQFALSLSVNSWKAMRLASI
jgi:hypothetical protein